jgi:hypothetical protein
MLDEHRVIGEEFGSQIAPPRFIVGASQQIITERLRRLRAIEATAINRSLDQSVCDFFDRLSHPKSEDRRADFGGTLNDGADLL